MKTPISYYGGKQMMVPVIVPMIAAEEATHELYSEPYFGGGAIFFAKKPVEIEVINDVNGELINFYRVVKSQYTELKAEIDLTLHSREQHKHAYIVYDNPEMFPQVKRAWAVWALSNQSFSSMLDGGWAYASASNSCEKKLDNKKKEFVYSYAQRLERVQIECNDAIKVIESRDREEALHYCDPPYFNSDMGHYADFNQADFERLLKTLEKVKGKFLLSSYPSDPLKEWTKKHNWFQVKIEKKIAVTKHTKRKKVEVLTSNYNIEAIYARIMASKAG